MDQWDLARTRLRRGPWNDETVNDIPQNLDPGTAAGQAAVEAAVSGTTSLDTLPNLPDDDYDSGKTVQLTSTNQVWRSTGDTWTQSVEGPAEIGHSSVLTRRLFNGDFALSPPDPLLPINNTTNPLPGWTVNDDGDDSSYALWVADATSGSGGRVDLHEVAADSILIYQDVFIRSTITRNNALGVVVSGSVSASHALAGVDVDVQEYDSTGASGALYISSSTAYAADATLQDLTFTGTSALAADTNYVRVYVGSGLVVDGVIHSVYEVQLVEGDDLTIWPDVTDPTNAPATAQYASGTLTIVADAVSIPTLSGFAPSTVDYLVGTASASLSGEIAVGTTPGGELGGTWASPTVDATHSGSAHSSFQPLDGTLTALAAYNTNGILVQTAADTFLGRSIAVGSGLSISNANGVGGNPNLDRAALTGDVTASAGSNATTLAAGNAANLNSGTLLAARLPALTGDVTTTVGTVATTIANDAVTYAKMQNVSATSRVLGRITAGAGDPEELTAANLKTIAGYYTSGDSPTFTGTNITGLPLGGMSNLAANSIIGNNTGSPATPIALTAAQVRSLLALVIGTNVQAWDADLDTLAAATVTTGTFTPALAYATVSTSTWATTTAVGFYTRLLDRVIFNFFYQGVPTNNAGAGNLQLTGLPVTSQNTASSGARFSVEFQGYTKANFTQITGFVNVNTTIATFRASGSAQTTAALTVTDIPTGGTVIVSGGGHYLI